MLVIQLFRNFVVHHKILVEKKRDNHQGWLKMTFDTLLDDIIIWFYIAIIVNRVFSVLHFAMLQELLGLDN